MPIFEAMADKANGMALSQREQGAHSVTVAVKGNGYKIEVESHYTSGCSGISCHATDPAAKRVYPIADER
jgi:hypothetical protein